MNAYTENLREFRNGFIALNEKLTVAGDSGADRSSRLFSIKSLDQLGDVRSRFAPARSLSPAYVRVARLFDRHRQLVHSKATVLVPPGVDSPDRGGTNMLLIALEIPEFREIVRAAGAEATQQLDGLLKREEGK